MRGDLSRLLALHNSAAPPERHWTRQRLESELCDRARDGGRQAVVAWRAGEPVGYAGWVSPGPEAGEFYGSPVMALDQETAARLLERLLAEARAVGAAWVRVGARPDETDKLRSLRAAGFRVVNEMVELRLEIAGAAGGPAQLPGARLRPVPLSQLDYQALAALNNDCFRQVANAPALDAETLREAWTGAPWLAASQVLADEGGRYQAFLLMLAGGIVDSIGVRAEHRGAGVAGALLARAVAVAEREGVPALRSMVTADNLASLALHRRLGFVEVHRRQIWERALR